MTQGLGTPEAALLGEAQIIVLIVLAQRILEQLYGAWNARRLLAEGAKETGREFQPVLLVSELAWLTAIFLLVPAGTKIVWPLLGLYVLLQGARYWLIMLLGRRWTPRIIVPRKARLVTVGPYRFLAHPWYALIMLETCLLPLVFRAWPVSVVMTAVMGAVLYYQIVLEDEALAPRRPA